MDIRHLKNFVAIVDCGSLSKAADRVFVAQSALSQQLALLESELGTQVLLRSSQRVLPTEAGKVLYRHARTLLRQMEQMREEVARPGAGEVGPVVFGLPSTMVAVLALPLYQRVRARLPGVRLHLFEGMSGYLGELLAHGRLDVAIQFIGDEARGVNVRPLLEEDLYLVGDTGGDSLEQVCPVRELHGVPMVLPLHAQGLRMVVERSFAASGVELNVVANVDSFRAMLAIAGSGDACAILPLSALMPRAADDTVPVRRLVEPGIRRAVGLAWSTSLPHTNAAAAVCRIVAELATELVDSGRWPGAVLADRNDR
jgi:LysR family nitrogen assimilation transcriptional regulator